ncbi:DEAD/DEAH box helicase [Bacillus suaedae]|uniref:DEAD/DEAH box helicase n=1 Tax=Halalkalibacter suaedae TaxID=2822140 RepID=A0A940WPR8_9BACI|nr:DEAD/DEAH box helicase [Bacillus suaedae]MBP3949583.1 DEAD/DEAH box helicase [Bacillus suaedae]
MTSNVIVHGGWLNDSFFIWGEQPPTSRFDQIVSFQYPFLYSPFELKLLLFRNDPISFYGTFVDEDKAIIDVPIKARQYASLAGQTTIYQAESTMELYSFPIEGIIFSVESLIEQLAFFDSIREDRAITLAPDFVKWLDLIDFINEMIAEGHFSPTELGNWQLDSFPYTAWFSSIPRSGRAIRPNTAYINSQEKEMTQHQFQGIVNSIADLTIRKLLKRSSIRPAYLTWQQSLEPGLQKQVKKLEEDGIIHSTLATEDFQKQIGVLEVKPFLSGLALKEPTTKDGKWKISLCMVDRKRPSLMVEMDQLQQGEHPWHENPIAQLKIDLAKAKEQLPLLSSLSLSAPVIMLDVEEAYELFTNEDQTLKQIGFRLIVPKWMNEQKKPRVTMQIEEEQAGLTASEPLLDWQSVASFTYEVALGDQKITQADFAKYVENQKPFLYVNGEWISWDRSLAEQLRTYLDNIEGKTSYLETWRMDQEDELEVIGQIDIGVTWGDQLTSTLKELYSTNPSTIPIPSRFSGELRTYQHEGVSWLAHLRRAGFGGCLADDMGLGKSVQTIVYMLYVIEQQQRENSDQAPFLLICPTSLIYNWVEECEQFAPTLRVFVHHGHIRLDEDMLDSLKDWDLVITSYQLSVRDEELFQQVRWNGLILDEAQHIKNIETKQRRVIKQIKAIHRVALTGTPIENRLRELWSLLDVLNPTYLGSYRDFQSRFMKPIERDRNEEQLKKLQKLIRPLILRRKKSDQSLDLGLPSKNEAIHRVHLSVEQAALYQAVVEDMIAKLDEVTALERRALILRSLTKLKQICNHPAHFLKERSIAEHESGKWDELMSLTDQMHRNGQKVLIFSQYKEMGYLMAAHIAERYDQEVPFLHGSLTRIKRQEAIQTFQKNEKVQFFILSLKAGGVGLNLTAASNVIHYDRWWNPAVENQATDRAYRIGQTKDVTVHKLVTVGTLEERIDRMLQQKQALADHILAAGEQRITELSDDEIIDLIKLS